MADVSDTAQAASNAAIMPEPLIEEEEIGEVAVGTVSIRWDVKGGKDRPHKAYLDTNYNLTGSPNIQGITIDSSVKVNVLCFGGAPDDTPDKVLQGPTSGKDTFTPIRLSSYRVERRN
ncbi:hypothetical protein E4U54_007463 [Claviceps lovelessii]|nr:hypothetical protein E4U54_007463 [Claviceps lovelessii]